MPPTPMVVIEIDDNSSPPHAPFSSDPSVWNLWDDLNLGTRTGADIFRQMHAVVDAGRFRGYPPQVSRVTHKLFDGLVDEEEVTWLSAAEFGSNRSWLALLGDRHAIEKSLWCLFETVDVLSRRFGPERVRLVFCFS